MYLNLFWTDRIDILSVRFHVSYVSRLLVGVARIPTGN